MSRTKKSPQKLSPTFWANLKKSADFRSSSNLLLFFHSEIVHVFERDSLSSDSHVGISSVHVENHRVGCAVQWIQHSRRKDFRSGVLVMLIIVVQNLIFCSPAWSHVLNQLVFVVYRYRNFFRRRGSREVELRNLSRRRIEYGENEDSEYSR